MKQKYKSSIAMYRKKLLFMRVIGNKEEVPLPPKNLMEKLSMTTEKIGEGFFKRTETMGAKLESVGETMMQKLTPVGEKASSLGKQAGTGISNLGTSISGKFKESKFGQKL